jgi:hypothetical protein
VHLDRFVSAVSSTGARFQAVNHRRYPERFVQLLNDNEEGWLPEEVSRIVKKHNLDGGSGVQWRSSGDNPLIDIVGKKKNPQTNSKRQSWFAKEQQVELFKNRKWGSGKVNHIDRSRQLIAAQSVPQIDVSIETTIQHDAPLPLGFMSAYAGGCAARCNDPTKFSYGSDGSGVTIYIVDGVCSLLPILSSPAVMLQRQCIPRASDISEVLEYVDAVCMQPVV